MKSALKEIWSKQKEATEKKVVKHFLEEVKPVRCYIGTIIANGAKMMSIEFDSDVSIHKNNLRRFSGVEIQELPADDTRKELVIILQEEELTDIFILFIDDLIKSINSGKNEEEVLLIIYNRINYWKKLFGKFTKHLLTKEQQRGLFGELFLMIKLLQLGYNPVKLINSWQAPEGTNQDFYLDGLVIEVKTSVSNTPAITISNELQLNSEGLKNLFIAFFELNELPNEEYTLTSKINEVREFLSSNILLLNEFNLRLEKLGFYPEDEEEYSETGYSVRNETYYEVTDGFPKIISSSVNDGIFNITYKISPLNCVDFEKPFEYLLREIE